jgi:hypothetical protein
MTKTRNPVLRLKVRGPGVRAGRISVPDLIRICADAQAAVKKQAEALEGRKTKHPGPVAVPIQQECTLELVAIKKGSTTLEFDFAKAQIPIPTHRTRGMEAVAELGGAIHSLGNGNKKDIDPGVLQTIYNLGNSTLTTAISEILWIAPQTTDRKRLAAPVNRLVQQRAAARLSSPRLVSWHVDGVLDMADFKPTEHKCRIDPAIGAPIPCTFPSFLADKVQSLLRRTVRGFGVATFAAHTDKIERLALESLEPLASIQLGEGHFMNSKSLVQLAELQDVKPLASLKTLAGAIPAEEDVDDFLEQIYCSRK